MEGPLPPGASADVVQVSGAVSVGLRPFAAEGGTEAVAGKLCFG